MYMMYRRWLQFGHQRAGARAFAMTPLTMDSKEGFCLFSSAKKIYSDLTLYNVIILNNRARTVTLSEI